MLAPGDKHFNAVDGFEGFEANGDRVGLSMMSSCQHQPINSRSSECSRRGKRRVFVAMRESAIVKESPTAAGRCEDSAAGEVVGGCWTIREGGNRGSEASRLTLDEWLWGFNVHEFLSGTLTQW